MLFTIAMDVLHYLLIDVDACSLLEPISGPHGIPHHLSLYVDIVALFLTPVTQDLQSITHSAHLR